MGLCARSARPTRRTRTLITSSPVTTTRCPTFRSSAKSATRRRRRRSRRLPEGGCAPYARAPVRGTQEGSELRTDFEDSRKKFFFNLDFEEVLCSPPGGYPLPRGLFDRSEEHTSE